VIIYVVECFSEKKKMPQLLLALFICTDQEEKLNRVVVGTPESTKEKKQPLKITEKLISTLFVSLVYCAESTVR
jgi:hypothetical protein